MKIWHRSQVRVMRSLAHIASGKASKPGTALSHVFKMSGRHNLGLGGSAHFHKGTQKKLDAPLFNNLGRILCRFHASLLMSFDI